MTLKMLAEKAHISASYLSQIENDSVNMNLSVLESISNALEIPPYTFFLEESLKDISLVRADERDITQRSDGVSVERLTKSTLVSTNVHIMVIPPKYQPTEYSVHPGEEFLFVFEGSLDVDFSGLETVHLKKQDALAYSSKIPHKLLSKSGCRIIMKTTTWPGPEENLNG